MPAVPAALADATRDFTGRAWVFEALDRWLAAGTARRMLIVGDPGTGKSALAARLVERADGANARAELPLSAAHFCRALVDQTLDPGRVFEGFALQLAGRYPAFADALASAPGSVTVSLHGTATAEAVAPGASVAGVRIGSLNLAGLAAREVFDRFLRRPLEALCAEVRHPVLLLVDSLDEALTYGGEQTLVDVLRAATDDPEELPEQVRLLFTSRPDPRAVDGMADATIDLVADAPPEDHDVRDYAERRLTASALGAGERAAVAERIATEGGGNFLYARYVLDDMLAHPEHLGDAGAIELPADLAGHYREFLRRELAASDQGWDRYQPVLGALAVAHGDGLTSAQLAGALELRRSEIDRVLRVVRGYLSHPGHEGRLRLYHQSFRDFLTAEGDYHVYPGEASERLAAYFIGENAGHWLSCDDPYAVAFTPSHMVEATLSAEQRRERERLAGSLCDLLTDLGYLTARVSFEHGRTGGLEQDCFHAATAVPEDVATTLAVHANAVRRESHVLAQRPGDLFVQLVNRLPEAAVDGEARPSAPWLRALHPLPLERVLRRTLSCHTDSAPAVAVTCDGTRAASASLDRTICLWDVAEGRLIRQWVASRKPLDAVAISADATQVISRDREDRVVLWDAATGSELRAWEGAAMAVTPDWSALALARDDGAAEIVRLPVGEPLQEWGIEAEVSTLVVAPDGTLLLLTGIDGSGVRLWRPDREEERVRLTGLGDVFVDVVALSEDGAVLVVGGDDGALWAWRRGDERRPLWRAFVDSVAVFAVAASAAARLALAGGFAGTIGVYELAGGEPITRLRGHTGQVLALALAGDGVTLLSAGGDGAVRVWDLGMARDGPPAHGHDGEVTALAVSGDGRLAASGAADGSLILWEIETGEAIARQPSSHAGRVGGLAFMPDGRLVSAGADNAVAVWDGKRLLPAATIQVAAAGESSDGRRGLAPLGDTDVLVGDEEGNVVSVDLATSKVMWLEAPVDDPIVALAATRDGTALAACEDGEIWRWSLATGYEDAELLGDVDEAHTLTLTPDERHALVGDVHGVITQFALDGHTTPRRLIGHVDPVDALALTADGEILVSGGWDATLRIWDLHAGEEVGRYTWELPLARAAPCRTGGRDLVVVGDRQGGVLFLTIER